MNRFISIFSRMRSSYSNKYFLSVSLVSFLVFIILTAFALLVSFYIYKHDVKNKSLQVHMERLNSYANQFDTKYNKIFFSVDQLVSDKNILDWMNAEEEGRNLYALKLALDKMNYISTFNEAVFSIEIYNAKDKTVTSNYYGFNNIGFDNEQLLGERKKRYQDFMLNKSVVQIAITSERIHDTTIPTITLLHSIPAFKKIGVIGLVIEASKLMPQNVAPAEKLFVVEANNPSVLLHSQNADPSLFGEDGEWIKRSLQDSDIGMHAVKMEGETYYTASKEMFNNQLRLIMLIPEANIEVNLRSFSDYFRTTLLIILLLCVLCSLLIYQIAHRPIKKMAHSVSRKMNDIYSDQNSSHARDDLKYLDHTFNKIISTSSQLEKAFLEYKEFFKENMLRKLFYGTFEDEDIQFYNKHYRLDKQNGFIVLIFNHDNHNQKTTSQVFDHADTIIFDHLLENYEGSYLRTGLNQYTMLVNLKINQNREILLDNIREMQESIRNHYGSTLTVGVSSIRHRFGEISLCFNEAQEAVKHKTLFGNDRIIDSFQLRNISNQVNNFPIQEGESFVRKLRSADEEEIARMLSRMIDEKKHQFPVELLNAYLLYISFCIGQVGMEYNINPDIIFDNNLFNIIIEHDTIEEMQHYLMNQCRKIIEVRNADLKKYKKLSGEIALKYIEENYNKPISLDILAAELHMSPSYLSRLIKQEIGKSFTTHINRLRIDKAIQLLQNGNIAIKEISAEVGYENEHTFIRNFKSFTGKTPADYRNTERMAGSIKKLDESR